MAPGSSDPFRDYHRGRFWMSLLKVTACILAASALVAGVLQLAAGAPPYAAQPAAARGLPGPAGEGPTGGSAARDRAAQDSAAQDSAARDSASSTAPKAEPTASATASAPAALGVAAAPKSSVVTGPGRWAIAINTTGYQAELDKCLWVRMDLGATAPIVGAHNNCGGSIVLAMQLGDIVALSGTALDGEYRLIDARNAHAGDSAATATSGWTGAVILQTCYFNSGGVERLLELERA